MVGGKVLGWGLGWHTIPGSMSGSRLGSGMGLLTGTGYELGASQGFGSRVWIVHVFPESFFSGAF